MQPSGIISVNIWQILVSLANLVILFLIVKKFLYKPVTKMLKDRQELLDNKNKAAQDNLDESEKTRAELEEKLASAHVRAEEILDEATVNAKRRGDKIIAQAQVEAEDIVRQAKTEAELEKKKAQGEIKAQIVDVSFALGEKLIEREINESDHRALIDSFISQIGDEADEK